MARLLELCERPRDPVALVQGALREEAVEAHAEALERLPDLLDHQLEAAAREGLEVGGVDPFGAQPLGELGHVLALVAALGDRLAGHPRRDRAPEQLDLGAVVVDVVLALDLVAARTRARARASRRTRRGGRSAAFRGPVGLALTNSTRMRSRCAAGTAPAPNTSPCVPHGRERVAKPGVGQEQVEEAGARDLDALERVPESGVQRSADALRDLTRRRLQRRCEQHRDVRGEVAELGPRRPLERRLRALGAVAAHRRGGLDDLGPQLLDRPRRRGRLRVGWRGHVAADVREVTAPPSRMCREAESSPRSISARLAIVRPLAL